MTNTLLCVICLRGTGEQTPAVTICSGEAVCRNHLGYIRVSDDTLRAIDRAYKDAR